MAFIAECPFCRIKLQKVPDHREGDSVECPRCHNLFTLTVMISPPKLRPAVAKLIMPPKTAPATVPLVVPTAVPALAPAVHVEAAIDSAAEVKPEPRPGSKETRTHIAAPTLETGAIPAREEVPRPSQPVQVHGASVAAFVLSGLAICTATLLQLLLPTFVLGGAAVLCAIIGLASAPRRTGAAKLPLAALLVSIGILALGLAWPTLFGVPTPGLRDLTEGAGPILVIPREDQKKAKGAGTEETPWVDATKGSIEHDDIRIQVASAMVKTLDLIEAKGTRRTREKYLVLTIRLNNLGNPQAIGFTSWGGQGKVQATLKDDHGRTYKLQTLGAGVGISGQISAATLAPGKMIEDVLVYAEPGADVQKLRLELPGVALGKAGTFRFEIPRRMLASR